MHASFKIVYFAALLSLPIAAHAQDADATKPGSAYFLGTWDCTGIVFEPHTSDIANVVSTWRFHRWPSGWVTDAFETYAGNGTHFAEWGWSKYDHLDGTYVRHAANTLGGHARYESTGWSDETWVWEGQAQGLSADTSPMLETITKKNDNHFWISVRFFDPQGTRRDLYKADCRRQLWHGISEGTAE